MRCSVCFEFSQEHAQGFQPCDVKGYSGIHHVFDQTLTHAKEEQHVVGQPTEGVLSNPMMNRNLMTSSTSMELNWLGETV